MKKIDAFDKCVLLSILDTLDFDKVIEGLKKYGFYVDDPMDVILAIAVLRTNCRRWPVSIEEPMEAE